MNCKALTHLQKESTGQWRLLLLQEGDLSPVQPRTQLGPRVSGVSSRASKAAWVKLSVGLGP